MRRIIILLFLIKSFNTLIYSQDNIYFNFYDNPIPFFGLNIMDSYDVVIEKISGLNYVVIVEEDKYRVNINNKYINDRHFIMYPDNQIMEEQETLNFILSYIGDQIASFSKYRIPKPEFDILVEVFIRRNDYVRNEFHDYLSSLINYEVKIDNVQFNLQFNEITGLGVFSYTNLDFFSFSDDGDVFIESSIESSHINNNTDNNELLLIDTVDASIEIESIVANKLPYKTLFLLAFLMFVLISIFVVFVFKRKAKRNLTVSTN